MSVDFRKTWLIINTLLCWQAHADDTIKVTVTATGKAMAVGYQVEGARLGGLGKTYSGQGPVNKKYSFGYRKYALGADIACGSIILSKNSMVKLVSKGEQCYTEVN
jgi:hypothetical protein